MSDLKKLPQGIYQILAEGGLALNATLVVGGSWSSSISVKPFEDKPSFKWLVQNVGGNMYRITNEGIGDHPHPGSKPDEPVHGEFSEYRWEIDASKSDNPSVYHVIQPGSIIAVWTLDPAKGEIFLTPGVAQEFTKFTFVLLGENATE